MRIYIAGPMRGRASYNWPAFDRAAQALRQHGHDVINPAELDRQHGLTTCSDVNGTEVEILLKRDFEHLATCDTLYLLPGWETSAGAQLEHQFAMSLGLRILTESLETSPAGSLQ